MPKFKFEITQLYGEIAWPGFFPTGLSHTENLDGCAIVVVAEFSDENEARRSECGPFNEHESPLWWSRCHNIHHDDSEIGFTISLISEVNETEASWIKKRNRDVLTDFVIDEPELYRFI